MQPDAAIARRTATTDRAAGVDRGAGPLPVRRDSRARDIAWCDVPFRGVPSRTISIRGSGAVVVGILGCIGLVYPAGGAGFTLFPRP
jgi:hypothetical protein